MAGGVWLLSFLFIAIAVGFLLGRLDGRRRQRRRLLSLSRNYARGLDFLLGEQHDQAIETFVRNLEINEHTYETHLALGRMFRKRGELDRATSLHQNLLDSPRLPDELKEDVQLELARDFLAAGLLDRAESIFQAMVDSESRHADAAMRHLMAIFEAEKDWHSALTVGEKLLRRDRGIAPTLAHYCCELAERLDQQTQANAARRLLRRALFFDEDCVRASLLQGRLELARGNPDTALRAFKRVRGQDPEFFDEVLDDLEECYRRLGREEELVTFLLECCSEHPSTALILKLSARLRERVGDEEAAELVTRYMQHHPTVRGMREMVELSMRRGDDADHEQLGILRQLSERLLAGEVQYQCHRCGFEARSLHWQCPGCKGWGTIRRNPEEGSPA